MDNNKKAIIEDIMNHMVNIQTLDYIEAGSTMRDKKSVDFKYNNHVTINSVIKKCTPCCSKDWNDFGIIRDEVYTSVYEVLTKIADDYTEEQLVQIYQDIDTKNNPETHQLLVSLYKLSIFKVKLNLSGNRRSSKGLIPAFDSCEYNEEVLGGAGYTSEDVDKDVCFFIKWFSEHKHEFLTKKQLQFIEDPSSVNEKNHSSFRKRIYNNTLEAFQEEFTNDNDRLNELESQISVIEKILDAKDFVKTYIKFRDKHYIIDAITTHVSMKDMQSFNKKDYSPSVIKAHRIALYKKLNSLNILLEQAKNED
jgi:hypothetical protein